MWSPAPGTVASPVYTPAVLQGELPPWALPTPSPSAMMRCPEEPGMRGGTTSGPTPVEAPLVPPELLWGVCMPFIQEMLKALQQAMQQEVAARLARAQNPELGGKGHTAQTTDAQEKSAAVGPFQSLFNPTPKGGVSMPSHRARRAAPADEPLHEETGNASEHEREERSSSTRTTSPGAEVRSRGDDMMKGRVTLVPSSAPSIGSSSKGTSPMLDDPDQPLGYKARGGTSGAGGSLGSSPVLQGVDPSRHAAMSAENNGPLYLKWQQQHPSQSQGKQCSSASWGGAGSAGAGEGAGPTQLTMIDQMARQQSGDCSDGDSTPDAERSVMVCRHWKSKGWCRLEDKCKFLHPEHKRGTSMKKGGGRGTAAGAAGAAGSAGTAGAEGATRSAKSRRGGKSRRNAQRLSGASADGDPMPAAMAIAPGLVQNREPSTPTT